MKIIFIAIICAIITYCIIITQNLYPFGYPVEQGKYYELTWIYYKGTPIESRNVWKIKLDSTYRGYVIRATFNDGQTYTDGTTMRRFVGSNGFLGPDQMTEISRETFLTK